MSHPHIPSSSGSSGSSGLGKVSEAVLEYIVGVNSLVADLNKIIDTNVLTDPEKLKDEWDKFYKTYNSLGINDTNAADQARMEKIKAALKKVLQSVPEYIPMQAKAKSTSSCVGPDGTPITTTSDTDIDGPNVLKGPDGKVQLETINGKQYAMIAVTQKDANGKDVPVTAWDLMQHWNDPVGTGKGEWQAQVTGFHYDGVPDDSKECSVKTSHHSGSLSGITMKDKILDRHEKNATGINFTFKFHSTDTLGDGYWEGTSDPMSAQDVADHCQAIKGPGFDAANAALTEAEKEAYN